MTTFKIASYHIRQLIKLTLCINVVRTQPHILSRLYTITNFESVMSGIFLELSPSFTLKFYFLSASPGVYSAW